MTRIGVFDSGMGGLTVLAALREALPGADYIYLGDPARLPYGTKSPATVTRYALQCAKVLVGRRIDLLVIACNTASAVALTALQDAFAPLPIIGVVEPGAEAGIKATRNGHIAVIATEGTVRGGAYENAIKARAPDVRVTQLACSLFVALAEEGWTNGPVALATARRYLTPVFGSPARERPDTLVLGCTHFPVLRDVIAEAAGPGIALVDSAKTTAAAVAALLPKARSGGVSPPRFLVTDTPERFARIGSIFLGEPIPLDAVELVDLA
jgi:glutamate racemase